MWDGATEVCKQFGKAGPFLALRGVVSGPVWAFDHGLSIRDRSRIPTIMYAALQEFLVG